MSTKTKTTAADQTLRLERRFKAPPERVFRAFTDAETLKKWWGPEGFTTPRADLDVRPGGAYAIDMRSPDGGVYRIRGEFREVVPPSRLVYTWSWQDGGYGGVATLVTIDFIADGKATLMRLSHARMTSDEMLGDHRDGWTKSLDRLEALCQGGVA
jgi:uncharacterized protein YndB with AHSA1/START domain